MRSKSVGRLGFTESNMTSVAVKYKYTHVSGTNETPKKISKQESTYKYKVFLGGACNPTTWRREKAIPYLERDDISFYNPQVEDWSPDLIRLEADAKKNAFVLLFVFDPKVTRGLASLVEVSYLAAQGRCLVIVRPDLSSISSIISGEDLPDTETRYILEALQWLDSIRSPNVHIFNQIEAALDKIKLLCKRYRLDNSYKYHPSGCEIPKSSLGIDLYCGGSTKLYDTPQSLSNLGDTRALFSQQNSRDFTMSKIVQNRCCVMYFYISRDHFWLVDQLEAAYAIGSGKTVIICIESVLDSHDSRLQDSGYNSLVTTPERDLGLSDMLAQHSSKGSTSIEPQPRLPTIHLSAVAVKDHNRARSYLRAVAEEEPNAQVIDVPISGLKQIMW